MFIFSFDSEISKYYIYTINILFLWPSLAVQAKRWHDRDKSGLWILINFAPYIGVIWALIETGILPGTVGDNVYGRDPLQIQRGAM